MRFFILSLLWVFCFINGANAEETESKELTTFEKLDNFFGSTVVGPLAGVLFYDLMSWDNTLSMGEGIGEVIDGKYIISFNDGAYQVAQQYKPNVDAVSVVLDTPIVTKNDYFTWKYLHNDELHQIVSEVPSIEIPSLDVELTPISDWKGVLPENLPELAGNTDRFVTEALTEKGVPVVIDRKKDNMEEEQLPAYQVLATTITAPKDRFALKEGSTVSFINEESKMTITGTVVSLELEKITRFEKQDGMVVRNDKENNIVVINSNDVTNSKETLQNPKNVSLPVVVVWLVIGALFFTFRMAFISLRGFGHAISVTRGVYDNPDDEGEVSHFQALSSALSATVGLGNIAGVAIAVSVGGPGAIFWMIMAGFLGMSSKFTECTLGQMYRTKDKQNRVLGGPMRYLDQGLKEMNMGGLGKVLAVIFALMCIGGSFGGGNMFQANQSFSAVSELVPSLQGDTGALIYGSVLAVLVGVVILGGIKSIGKVAGIIVPFMCGIYVLAGLYILLANAAAVPDAIGVIFSEAFATDSAFGGLIGALIQGFRRAAFSNEAGVGSASIAHSAAATDEPVREGIVALLEPFIDTIIVCSMTGIVVVITGAYLDTSLTGVEMTSAAFGSVISWFPIVLSIAVFFFAFSTMISWSYYGERCAIYLFGDSASLPYKIIFLLFVVMGSVIKLGNVLDFSDLMILGMAFPNILGLFLLSGKVRTNLDDYWRRLSSGEMKRYDET
jgi:alanine or glycine:cation symporter, AGCS family